MVNSGTCKLKQNAQIDAGRERNENNQCSYLKCSFFITDFATTLIPSVTFAGWKLKMNILKIYWD